MGLSNFGEDKNNGYHHPKFGWIKYSDNSQKILDDARKQKAQDEERNDHQSKINSELIEQNLALTEEVVLLKETVAYLENKLEEDLNKINKKLKENSQK